MLKINVTELRILETAEMEALAGGGGIQTTIGGCDLCFRTKYEKQENESEDNTPSKSTTDEKVNLL